MFLPPLFLRHCRYSDGIQADIFAKVRDLTKRHETQQSSPKPVNCGLGVRNADQKWFIWVPKSTKYRVSSPARFQEIFYFWSLGWPQDDKKNEFQAFFGKRKPKLAPRGTSNSRKNDFQSVSNQFSKICPMQNAQNTGKGKRTNSITNPRSRDALYRQNAGGEFSGRSPAEFLISSKTQRQNTA